MTNKEAIEYIKLIFVRDRANELHFISHDEEIALNLAIKALEEQVQKYVAVIPPELIKELAETVVKIITDIDWKAAMDKYLEANDDKRVES